MSNKNISVSELARVVEVDASDFRQVPNSDHLRAFVATCANGTESKVMVDASGDDMGDRISCYCLEHRTVNHCEHCVRVLCVLSDERTKRLKMSLVGYAITNDTATTEKPALQLLGSER